MTYKRCVLCGNLTQNNYVFKVDVYLGADYQLKKYVCEKCCLIIKKD